jgi:hypothetical protein
MVAKQLRTVFQDGTPGHGAAVAGGVSPQVRIVFEVCVVASDYPDEGQSASEGADPRPELPFRAAGAHRAGHTEAHTEARAELRDRETYYVELRLAVQGQNRSLPRPRAAVEDPGADSWTRRADMNGGSSTDGRKAGGDGDMTARIDDTWT